MKQAWNSFLQYLFQFVNLLPASAEKKRRRDTAVLTAGVFLVTAITFAAGSFPETGNGAMVAFAETPGEKDGREEETDGNTAEEERATEQTMAVTEAADTENEEETEESQEESETTAEAGPDPEEETEQEAVQSGAAEEPEAESAAEAETGEAPKEAASAITLPDRDYQTLLKIVQAEAGNCDRTGRILVANVILNRVESDAFPDTVHGVVYQRNQFSPVGNGSINRCKVSRETVEAVDSALAGEDYSGGALYFMNRRASSGKNVQWFDNHLDFLFKHGNHEFFK